MFKSILICALLLLVGIQYLAAAAVPTGYIGTRNPAGLRLKNISGNEGLPGETVRDVFQSSDGYLWLGIESVGLCRFDGNGYMVFGADRNDSTSLSSDFIEDIAEDCHGNIWVATDNGLNRLATDVLSISKGLRFTRFYADTANVRSLSDNIVQVLRKDASGRLWVGTDSGLDYVADDNGSFVHFDLMERVGGKGRVVISAIYEDSHRNLWVGTSKGLFMVDPSRHQVKHWEGEQWEWHNNPIGAICEDKNGLLWLGMRRGMALFDPLDGAHSRIDYGGKTTIVNNSEVNCIVRDNNNRMWVSTTSSGLLLFDIDKNSYRYMNSTDKSPTDIATNQIRSLAMDANGRVWIAVKNKGLYVYDHRVETFGYLSDHPVPGMGLSDKQVLSIFEDDDRTLWIGTRFGGLNKYDPVKGTFACYRYSADNPYGIGSNRIETIVKDRDGIFWLGTVNGLVKFDKRQGRFWRFGNSPIKVLKVDALNRLWIGAKDGLFLFDRSKQTAVPVAGGFPGYPLDRAVTAMEFDTEGNLWMGTQQSGLVCLNYDKNEVYWYKNHGKAGDLSGDMVRSIYNDRQQQLWVGTKHGGLNLFRPQTQDFVSFNTSAGLLSNNVYSIAGDDKGRLWLATNMGIDMFDCQTKRFDNFSTKDGLTCDVFISGAICQTRQGTIYFGSDNGINYIDPSNLSLSRTAAKTVLNAVKVNQESLGDGHFRNGKTVFAYNDYVSFDFGLLDFSMDRQTRYYRKLEGFDGDWIDCGNHNYATYAKLPPGKYRFWAKGIDADGVESLRPASFSFEVLPPWWLSIGAKLVYLLLIGGGFYLFFWFVRFRARKDHQLGILSLQKEQAEEMSHFKIRYFTHLSHEIRIPLTLMLPLVDRLREMKKMPPESQGHLMALKKNTLRLLNLVDELLLFRQIEQG